MKSPVSHRPQCRCLTAALSVEVALLMVLTMCAGAVLGATMTLHVVAPVIGLAAAVVTTAAPIFAFGSPAPDAG